MNKDEMLQAWETRKSAYANSWKTGLCGAIVADPACCCISMCCPMCASFVLRKRALYNDMSNYRCCGGFLPCAGRCGESSCPEVCLCCEVFWCFGTSVAVTRWMIQDELRIQNSRCDNCLLATMIFFQQLACLCQIAACITGDDTLGQLADFISFIADILWCTICACVQTQQKVQLDERDAGNRPGASSYPQPTLQPPQPHQDPMYDRQVGGAPGYAIPGYPTVGAQQTYAPQGYPQQQMYR